MKRIGRGERERKGRRGGEIVGERRWKKRKKEEEK
jgi:hypothetical protein